MHAIQPAGDDVFATFDEKLRIYLVLYVGSVMAATVAGLALLPFWIVLGPFWANLYFPSIEARLTGRSLVYRHGIWFRQEMSIPLDKIQDVSMHHGPVLDWFGLARLRVETAGGGQAGSAATLIGVVGAAEFRSAIIARRDALVGAPRPVGEDLALLTEIRDSLHRIEGLLARER